MECHAFLGRQTVDGWSPPVEFRERGSCAMDGEADQLKTWLSPESQVFYSAQKTYKIKKLKS